MAVSWLDDWLERALSCFHREAEESSGTGKGPPTAVVDPLDPASLSAKDVDNHFNALLAQLELSEEKERALAGQSTENKIAMLRNRHAGLVSVSPSSLVSSLSSLAERVGDRSLPPLPEDSDPVGHLQDVVTALRTAEHSFLEEFLSSSGLDLLVSLLVSSAVEAPASGRIALFCLSSIRALLNSNQGRKVVLTSAECLVAIVQSVGIHDIRVKISGVEILSGLCFASDEGPALVLTAITQATTLLGERTRFQRFLDDLHRDFHSERETDRLRTALMSLVNALLRTGNAEHSPEFRLHLRYEMLLLGIQEVLDKIRADASPRLGDHIELFEMMRREDEMFLGRGKNDDDSGASSPVDFESPGGMAEALAGRLGNSVALTHFISLLQHLFMVPCDEKHVPLWRLFDLVLQHICLQSTLTGITDVHKDMPSMDMADVLCRLHTHCEFERVEQEVELLKEQLKEEKRRIAELETGGGSLMSPVSPPASPSSLSSGVSTASESSLLPPVVSPPCAPPPPPPPPFMAGLAAPKKAPKKDVPAPRVPMKTLNWRKIPLDRIKGTGWEGLEDEKLYKQLDLVSLETQFAAPSGTKDDDTETIAGTISRRSREKISVIDARKAQNCTIMLSKLRMPNREIRRSLLKMDERIPKDMIEQMLKFVPSERELRALKEVVTRFGSSSALATADAFLYETSQIPRYEQRLKCLHIIRTFKDRLDLLEPSIAVVARCSSSLIGSRRFKQLLSLVLALGNYLNYGKRSGDAYGFELGSLLSLSELRSSVRADRTLLHALCQILDDSFPEIGKIRMELGPLAEAARFNKAEVLTEMHALERALGTVRMTIDDLRKDTAAGPSKAADSAPFPTTESPKDEDAFCSVASAFVASASADFEVLERAFYEMQSKFSECTRLFCADGAESPDDFFSVLARFVGQLAECQQQIWMENEHAAQVKRQTIARSFFARKNRKRDKEQDFEKLISALQSGELFSDELSRLRTSFRVSTKMAPAVR